MSNNLRELINLAEDALFDLKRAEMTFDEQRRLLDLAKGQVDQNKAKLETAITNAETPNFTKRQIKQLVENRLSELVDSGVVTLSMLALTGSDEESAQDTAAAKPRQTRTRRNAAQAASDASQPADSVAKTDHTSTNVLNTEEQVAELSQEEEQVEASAEDVAHEEVALEGEVAPAENSEHEGGVEEQEEPVDQEDGDDDELMVGSPSSTAPRVTPAAPVFLTRRAPSIPVPTFRNKE